MLFALYSKRNKFNMIQNDYYHRIELIFRNSNSPDELFDTFNDAIKLKITDLSLYKIFLGNPALSVDELKMFTGKLLKEIPENRFPIGMWAAKIFENRQSSYEFMENAIHYYILAMESKPDAHEPLLEMIRLYNIELDLPCNRKILELLDTFIPAVNSKSKVYFALADLYKKKNDLNTATKYLALANKAAERERD
jgi:tetratricopeptide (TPR) repeat protein